MDATSIITQVARDDEQLNVYPNEKGKCNILYLQINMIVKCHKINKVTNIHLSNLSIY